MGRLLAASNIKAWAKFLTYKVQLSSELEKVGGSHSCSLLYKNPQSFQIAKIPKDEFWKNELIFFASKSFYFWRGQNLFKNGQNTKMMKDGL